MKAKKHIVQLIAVLVLALAAIPYFIFGEETKDSPGMEVYNKSIIDVPFRDVVDTVFTLSDSYIEISLSEQVARLYLRNEDTKAYKISSGTDKIHKGMKTPSGLYTVQNKTPLARSRQFNNAELINWIGFYYNIGFHGLKGNSYYSYLGNKPSSHGCIRIGREDGKDLYDNVNPGTPVIVYENKPARVIAFICKEEIGIHDFILNQRGYYQKGILDERISSLYSGDYYKVWFNRLILDGETILRPGGYDIGLAEKVSSRQEFWLPDFKLPNSIIDNLSVIPIERYFND